MDGKISALALFAVIFASSMAVIVFSEEETTSESNKTETIFQAGDPLFQGEGHDHMNASQHRVGSENIEQLAFNPLTSPGNAEVSVARSPDGRV